MKIWEIIVLFVLFLFIHLFLTEKIIDFLINKMIGA